jgi:predicted hydrocarbon binding protein
MSLKSDLVTWFVQNIISPNLEDISKPGFVITSVSKNPSTTFLRDIFFPEEMFVEIENSFVKKDPNFKKVIYSIGKNFGYFYSKESNFDNIANTKEKDFLDFCDFLTAYIGAIYASKAENKVDLKNKVYTLEALDYAICSKNGMGYILADGGVAGIWADMVNDKSIEGVQTECQGRGDKRCFLIVAPAEYLKKNKYQFISSELGEFSLSQRYSQMNKVRPTQFSKYSLKSLVQSKVFSYAKGKLAYKEFRHMHVESLIAYLLEKELVKSKELEKELFDACARAGRKIGQASGESDFRVFVTDYFSATGWGDVQSLKTEKTISVNVRYFPWHDYKTEFLVFRGLVSGVISGIIKKDIYLNLKGRSENDGNLSINLEADA